MWLNDLFGPEGLKMGEIAKTVLTAGIPAVAAYLLARYQYKFTRKSNKEEIIRRYLVPLLTSARELEDRLAKMLDSLEADWLDRKYIEEIKNGKGFAENPTKTGYFFISTLYLFAKFFSRLETISQEIGHAYELSSRQAKEFENITNTISRIFQYREMWDQCETVHRIRENCCKDKAIRDAWRLHRQFQHSIGELLICREGGRARSMSFKQFFERYITDKAFRYWCDAIEDYVVDLSSMGDGTYEKKAERNCDMRIFRIVALRYWLLKLMRSIERDINATMDPEPRTVLNGVPLDIQKEIEKCSSSYKDAFFN